LLYKSLTSIDSKGNYQLDLAQNLTLSGSRLNFSIEPTHLFWDGSLLTCEDLIYSIESFQKSPSPFKNAFKVITEVQCEKKDLIELSFNISVNRDKFLRTDLPVLKILKKNQLTSHLHENIPIGSGNFQVLKSTHQKIILKRKDSLIFHFEILKDPFMRYVKTYKGDIDISIGSLPLNKIKFLQKQTHLDILVTPSLNTTYLLINHKNPWLSKKENRLFIQNSINKKLLIKYKLAGFAEPADSFIPTLSDFSIDLNSKNLQTKTTPNNIPSLNFKTSNAKSSRERGSLLKDQMRQAGIPVRLQSFEWGTFLKDLNKANYDLALLKWVGVLDPDIFRMAYHSDEIPPKGRNRSFYSHQQLDKWLDLGLETSENSKRKEFYSKAQKFIFNEVLSIPLWHEKLVTVKSKRIADFRPDSRGSFLPLNKISLKD